MITRRSLLGLFAVCGLSLVAGSPSLKAQPRLVLKLATTEGTGSALWQQLGAVARALEAASAGQLQVKLFGGGALGDDPALLERVRAGSIQAYAGRLDALASAVPAASVLSAPYLFDGAKSADAALDGPARATLAAQLQKQQLRFALWGPSDFRVWFSRGEPLNAPADFKGLRGPAPRSKADALLHAALGLSPAAGQGAAQDPELFDATLLDAAAASLDRKARHVTLSRHALEASIVVYSQRFYDGLPEDLQAALDGLPAALTLEARRAQRDAEPRLRARLTRLGVEVHEPTKAQRKAFARAASDAAERAAEGLGPDARALLRSAR